MRKFVISVAAALLAGCVSQAESPPAAADPAAQADIASEGAAVERGSLIAQRTCATCHAVGRGGASPATPAPPLREVARGFDQPALQQRLADIAERGHFRMPARQFTPAQIPDLVAYINSLEAPAGS